MLRILSGCIVLGLVGCAGQFPPSGGPVDTTPPQIVMSSPSLNQLNFNLSKIRIEFDKYMVERSVESSIYFPPFGLNDLEFDWSGKELDIKIKKPLEKDRTYIFTIGARAQDIRGNYLGKAYNIVFSTGDKIDTGTVTGRVFAQKLQPYTIAAYPANPDIDTLRPSMCLPKFVTQSDDSGRYVLQGLAVGKYRLICFNDEVRNFTYAPQVDLYASATHDVEITGKVEMVRDVNFMVAMEDTSRPQLYSADLANNGLLLLKFSEPIDTAYILPSYFMVRDSASGDTLPVDFAARLESDRYNTVIATATPLTMHRKYFVTATDSVRDLQGNTMASGNNTIVIQPDSASASLQPYFFNFADSLKGVTSYDTLFCQFVIPSMNGHPTNPQVDLLDSTGRAIAGVVARESATMFQVNLRKLDLSEWYTLRLRYQGYLEGAEKDSVVLRRFRMIDSTALGDLEGTVIPADSRGRIVVGAEAQAGKTFYTLADSAGDFKLDGIPSGVYTVRAYVRHGRDMKYFYGRSYPYRFAEPFGVYENPVKVRARWTTEGVEIRMY